MTILLTFLTALAASLLAVRAVRSLAISWGIGALPGGRRIHKSFIPLMGGVGIFFGIVAGALIANLLGWIAFSSWDEHAHFWLGLAVILITGIVDDIRGVSPKQKFAGQLLAASLAVFGGCFIEAFYGTAGATLELNWFSIPFSIVWIIFVINAVNLLDGLDGLASGVSTIIMSGFLILTYMTGNSFFLMIAVSFIAANLGFLRYNYRPASIFMGDSGSLMLGYVLAVFSIETLKVAATHQVYFLASLVMLGMPITDTLISFFRRLGRGDHPFKADKEHIHHRLTALGLSHLETVWLMYYFTVLFALLGVLMVVYRELAGMTLFLVGLGFSIFWAWRLGYVETRRYITFGTEQHATEATMRPPIHINRIWHQLLVLFGDVVAITVVLYLTHWFRFYSGMINPLTIQNLNEYFANPVFLVFTAFWLLLFWLNGLYNLRWDRSRFDIVLLVSKVVTFGILFWLMLLNLDLLMGEGADNALNRDQLTTLGFYWGMMIVLVNAVRLLIIKVEKRFHLFEYDWKNTLLIGTTRKARQVIRDIKSNPHLIYRIAGIVERKPEKPSFEGFPVVGSYQDLPDLIHEHQVEEIIVALSESAREDLLNIIGICDRMQVVVKTLPALQSIVSGNAPGLAGHGLVRVFPDQMMLWQWIIKRFADITIAAAGIVCLMPVWLPLTVLIKARFGNNILSLIPILGKNGRIFRMRLFSLGVDDDITRRFYGGGQDPKELSALGQRLFRFNLYKIPMLFNVLRGDMSIVGPRPEFPEWYKTNQHKLRFLQRRLMVRPGLTGMAQYKFRFDRSQQNIKERVKFDIFYVENISLNLDLRIILRSMLLLITTGGREEK